MAVIDEVPGVEVTVNIAGSPLPQYDDEIDHNLGEDLGTFTRYKIILQINQLSVGSASSLYNIPVAIPVDHEETPLQARPWQQQSPR
jgi:hypothetical protein